MEPLSYKALISFYSANNTAYHELMFAWLWPEFSSRSIKVALTDKWLQKKMKINGLGVGPFKEMGESTN